MDIIILLISIIFGVIFGIITGLTPGIHINMISMFLLVNIIFLQKYFDNFYLIIFIITMGVIHSFIDFIPSILFGVPDPDTTLSILPSQQMVLNGQSYEAIFLSSIGSLFGTFFSFLIIPIFYFNLEIIYNLFKDYIWIFLSSIIIFLILSEKDLNNIFFAIIITIFSGSFGILILNSNIITQPLLILFSGIFGVASLINSLLSKDGNIPKQEFKFKFKINKKFFKSIFIGGISASICSITPGIGNSQAAILSSFFFKNITSKLFIITTSSINTINFILSFLTFYLIQKTRNGSVFVISQINNIITIKEMIYYFILILIISIIGFFLTLIIGKKIIKIIFKFNLKKINLIVLLIVIFTIYLITGIFGILALICSSMLGLFTILIGVKRVHLMNVLLIPILFNLI